MGVNIVANFVSPAYDLANVWPQKITFKVGGMISTVAALVVTPGTSPLPRGAPPLPPRRHPELPRRRRTRHQPGPTG
nr:MULTISPECIES: cytosine permease [Streptomyces]